MSALPKQRYTPEQYLEMDRRADYPSEYIDGQIFARGESPTRAPAHGQNHSLIVLNIASELHHQLKTSACEVYGQDMGIQGKDIKISPNPDVSVVRSDARFLDDEREILLNPTVIVEVLSPSTELYDRSEKFMHYRRLESLTDYLLVSQDKARIEQYTRQPDGRWLLAVTNDLASSLEIESIGCRLVLSDVYDKVDFTPTDTIAST